MIKTKPNKTLHATATTAAPELYVNSKDGALKFDEPPHFSHWVNWKERESLSNLSNPGVYAISISHKQLAGEPFEWRADIVYFGLTNSIAGLKGRLKQFDNTIIGKNGHGGAQRFMHDFKNIEELVPNLYVAVWSFACDVRSNKPKDLVTMGRVAKAEYECFAKHVELHGQLPKYNDKKRSPKR